MKKNRRYVGWVSWVCVPHYKPYCGHLLSDTKEKAESVFRESNGNRSPMFSDCKIVHQKITIAMPDEVVDEHDKWLKSIGGLS